MKVMHCEENEFILTKLPVVVAILGIITAVIIPSLGTFMTMGTVSASNNEVENVQIASPDYYADVQKWPNNTASVSASGNYSFTEYYAGTLKAKYYFDNDGFISGVSDTIADTPDSGGVCSEYKGIHWENPDAGIGHVE